MLGTPSRHRELSPKRQYDPVARYFWEMHVAVIRPETTRRRPLGQSQHDQTKSPAAERLVYTVPEAGRLLGLSRNGAYDAAKRGDIPTIRIGRLLLVPKRRFHQAIENLGTGPSEGEHNNVGGRNEGNTEA